MAEFKPIEGRPGFIHAYVPRFKNPSETKKMVMVDTFTSIYEEIKNLEVYEDDTWIVTYPKSGTTWMQELAWLVGNNLDYEAAMKTDIQYRVLFLEYSIMDPYLPQGFVERVKNAPRPRFIKSHLPADFLPDQIWQKNPKIIYVSRDPRDVACSMYHFFYSLRGFNVSFDDNINNFVSDSSPLAPYFEHVLDFWNMRDRSNILFVKYEDMKRDLTEVLKKVAAFLEKSYSEEELARLGEHLSFENMRKNPSCNNEFVVATFTKNYEIAEKMKDFQFLRKGIVGSHKEELNPEHQKKMNDWVSKNLENTDYTI